MKTLYLLRGLPGSGKSTLAMNLVESSVAEVYMETDMYFVDPVSGEYNFDASQIKKAHEWCKMRTNGYMGFEKNIVVSNTFTQEWEIQPYLDMAEEHGYKVVSLIVENRHGGESVHDVPSETIDKMENRFEIKLR